jgi:hypothetical protein
MSYYRTEIFTEHWADQGFVFSTQSEAIQFGLDQTHLSRRPYRVVLVDELPSHRYAAGKLTPYRPMSLEESWRWSGHSTP